MISDDSFPRKLIWMFPPFFVSSNIMDPAVNTYQVFVSIFL